MPHTSQVASPSHVPPSGAPSRPAAETTGTGMPATFEGIRNAPAYVWELPVEVRRGNPSLRGRTAAKAWHDLGPEGRAKTTMRAVAKMFDCSPSAMCRYVDVEGKFTARWYQGYKPLPPTTHGDHVPPATSVAAGPDADGTGFPTLTAAQWATVDAAMLEVLRASNDGP